MPGAGAFLEKEEDFVQTDIANRAFRNNFNPKQQGFPCW